MWLNNYKTTSNRKVIPQHQLNQGWSCPTAAWFLVVVALKAPLAELCL